ncbi:hypothetical protein QBC39DRAFT_343048 [Podospora conica]|nr:hypothetical protein QBC39DRAFT_343048 [Schizothecium conicum]
MVMVMVVHAFFTFASARGIRSFLVKTMRPSVRRDRHLALSGHASRPQPTNETACLGGIDFAPRHRISTTLPSHQRKEGGARGGLTLLHHRHDTTASLATATSRQWTDRRGICDRQRHQLGGRGTGFSRHVGLIGLLPSARLLSWGGRGLPP